MDHGRDRRQEELRSSSRASTGSCSLQKRRTATRLRCGVLFLALVAAQACATQHPTAKPTQRVLTIGVPEGIAAGDLGARQLSQALSLEGLTQLSADGRVLPRLADSWSWENDNLRLRVRLHPGVVSHDGSKLTAAIVATALQRAVSRPGNRALCASVNYVSRLPEGAMC